MYEGSRYVLYVGGGVPAPITGIYAPLVVVAMGPTDWFVVAILALAALATRTWTRSDEGAADAAAHTNCAECGVPNPVDVEVCEYCDASLGGT